MRQCAKMNTFHEFYHCCLENPTTVQSGLQYICHCSFSYLWGKGGRQAEVKANTEVTGS